MKPSPRVVRCLVLLPEPFPSESDISDPTAGRCIVDAVEAAGGWLNIEDVQAADGWNSIEHGRIVLRWRGDFPGDLIDRIRANRTGIVAALGEGNPPDTAQ